MTDAQAARGPVGASRLPVHGSEHRQPGAHGEQAPAGRRGALEALEPADTRIVTGAAVSFLTGDRVTSHGKLRTQVPGQPDLSSLSPRTADIQASRVFCVLPFYLDEAPRGQISTPGVAAARSMTGLINAPYEAAGCGSALFPHVILCP